MTKVLLVRHSNGELQFCSAEGHSDFAVRGTDIVCAAVTTLLRTTLEVLENTAELTIKAESASRGKLAFRVEQSKSVITGSGKKLMFAGDFLEIGLKRLVTDYPKNVSLQVKIID